MKYIHRELEKQVAQAARHFPAVVLSGAKEPPARHHGRVASRTSIVENPGRNPRGRPRSARMGVAGFRQPALMIEIVLRDCRICLTMLS